MKILNSLEKIFNTVFIVIICIGLLTWLGIFNPFEKFESAVKGDVIDKLSIEAHGGDADAQNKLGTLLYTEAKKQKGDFNEAIRWLEEASQQKHPVAQMNLAIAYETGIGVVMDNEKAIQLFYQSGLNFLRMGFPMDAKDSVFYISKIDSNHPLRRDLINAIKQYEEEN